MERLPLFDEIFSKNVLRPHIQLIAKAVLQHVDSFRQPGWMTGLAGMAVFLGEYGEWEKKQPIKNDGGAVNGQALGPAPAMHMDVLHRIVDIIDDGFDYPTLAAGLTGILFAFQYLGERDLIDADDAHALDGIIPFLEKYAKHEIENGNLDPLHGGTGPAILNIARAGQRACPFDGTPNIDLGLAHGLPSYLLFLSKIENQKAEFNDAIDLLLLHADFTQKHASIFPTKIKDGKPEYPSRLAWCYGDAGIGMTLLNLNNSAGERILEIAALRRDPLNTRVEDPFLCHGSSGLALIFYKAWLLSKNDKLFEAAQYWTLETLKYLDNEFLPSKSSNITLLNGLPGIGLLLMATDNGYLPGWEKGLLI